MKITLPPTGGQGGHYGQSPPPAPRLFNSPKPRKFSSSVPRRLRGVRLRRRKRLGRRMAPQSLGVRFVVLLLMVLIPLSFFALLVYAAFQKL